jgi:hypothetical protein
MWVTWIGWGENQPDLNFTALRYAAMETFAKWNFENVGHKKHARTIAHYRR